MLKSSQTSSEGREPTAVPGLFEFEGFVLDPLQRVLRTKSDGKPVRMGTRAFEALLMLAEYAGEVVEKAKLMQRLWPRVVVEENNLTQTIYELRQAFGGASEKRRLIVTEPNRGYRLATDVTRVARLPQKADSDQLTSMAVLPLANLTGDPGKDYLGDGMAEELIIALSRLSGLRVAARTSTFAYKGRLVDARQIAADLGVKALLEGSVRISGDRIRISVQLNYAADGFTVWSESYERRLADLFQLQDELSTAIVRALQSKLNLKSNVPMPIAAATPAKNVEAYHLYLQGRSLLDRPTQDNVSHALTFFGGAAAHDSSFARAYFGMAEAHIILGHSLADIDRPAQQALELDPTLALAQGVQALLAQCRGQWKEGYLWSNASVESDGGDSHVRIHRAQLLAHVGHLGSALQEGEVAYRGAPASAIVVAIYAWINNAAGRSAEARKYGSIATGLGFPVTQWPLPYVFAGCAFRAGLRDEALSHLITHEDFHREADPTERADFVRIMDSWRRGAGLAASSLAPTSMTTSTGNIFAGYWRFGTCCAFAIAGDQDRAYRHANECLKQLPQDCGISPLALVELWTPEMSEFRRDSRFQKLVEHIGLMEFYEEFGPPDGGRLEHGKLWFP